MLILPGCGEVWNNPYPGEDPSAAILYQSFRERPKHLDPARAYSSDEFRFIGQIYQPPLEYHYLKRPYQLQPLTVRAVPEPVFLDEQEQPLKPGTDVAEAAFSEYTLDLKPGIRYQPHPAFATDERGRLLYHDLDAATIASIRGLADFKHQGTRELRAADYAHQIKRLAHPTVHSPIVGLMGQYIVGLEGLRERLKAKQDAGETLDLGGESLPGVRVEGDHRLVIRLKGVYPQFVYWLAMPFFAPMPPEADAFYAQDGLDGRNISLDWFPIGTGAYMLTENNPNRRMVLERNPNFRTQPYPSEGMPDDEAVGMLADAGRPMPFIERAVYSLEKESIPYWSKFLQGWYDASAISSDSFDQAVSYAGEGDAAVSPELAAKGIALTTSVATSSVYFGFNMLDETVGGLDARRRALRQAIGIALDWEEYVSIFQNGRGEVAHGPLPPGIFGHRAGQAGMNAAVYRWQDGKPRRKPLAEARRLLAEAGYPDGIDAATGRSLLLNFDTVSGSSADSKAKFDWFRKQFRKLGIQLVIRSTDYNRFRDKMLNGTGQMFMWGWNADYPDPENFLFLLHGEQAKALHKGENASNYRNPEFDRLFERMKNMANGPQRQAIIDRMVRIARQDSPWLWGYHPKDYSLNHGWYHNVKPNLMAHNTLKYRRIDTALRERQRQAWNQPVLWPLWLGGFILIAFTVPAAIGWWRAERVSQRERGAVGKRS
ncbi:MAG: ABC transporter substrate-binding protein [Gammaproteobacteria bacterium]